MQLDKTTARDPASGPVQQLRTGLDSGDLATDQLIRMIGRVADMDKPYSQGRHSSVKEPRSVTVPSDLQAREYAGANSVHTMQVSFSACPGPVGELVAGALGVGVLGP